MELCFSYTLYACRYTRSVVNFDINYLIDSKKGTKETQILIRWIIYIFSPILNLTQKIQISITRWISKNIKAKCLIQLYSCHKYIFCVQNLLWKVPKITKMINFSISMHYYIFDNYKIDYILVQLYTFTMAIIYIISITKLSSIWLISNTL